MRLRFAYTPVRIGTASIPLGGRSVYPRPLVVVSVVGPVRTRAVQAIIDTASDETVFPGYVSTFVGIDLATCPVGHHRGIGRTSFGLRYASVELRLSDGRSHMSWPATIGFSAAPLKRALLGFAGFLQFFTTTFHGDREFVELTPNALFPGP